MSSVTGPDGDAPEQVEQTTPGFGERGRMRRRARFLRKTRELAYRDLGGLVFDLHRFGQRNDQVVRAKLATLTQIDAELRALERALDRHEPVTVLREVGIAACPRCAAIHGRDDRFCPGCGLAFDANAERPLATAPVPTAPMSAHGSPGAPAPGETPGMAPQQAAPTPSSAAPSPVPWPTAPAPAPGTDAAKPSEAAPAAPAPPAAPAVKPTAAPVAAPSTTRDEDEPTQVLNPPVRGT